MSTATPSTPPSAPVPSAPQPSVPSVIESFTLFIRTLCRAVVEPKLGGLMIGPLTSRVWSKLQRLSADFTAFAAQVRAGTLPLPPARRPRRPRDLSAPPRTKSLRPVPPPPPWAALVPPRPPLPRGFGWLLKYAPVSRQYRGQLLHILAQPETQALIAAAPDEAHRRLNPLCHMLGIRFPKLPKSPHPDALPPPSGTPSPASSEPPASARPAKPPAPEIPATSCSPVTGYRPLVADPPPVPAWAWRLRPA
jgi:hypothetical protein